jgi:peptidoglycan/LPS O-acetylase OafA/YrhL
LIFLFGLGTAKLFYQVYKSLKSSMSKTSATILEVISLLFIIDFIFWGNLNNLLNNLLLFINFPFDKSLKLFTKNYLSTVIPTFLLLITFGIEKGFIAKFLTMRIFVFLGEISYALFMVHQPFFRILKAYRKFLFNTFGESGAIIIIVILVIPLSIPIYKYIENPVRKRLRVDTYKTFCP